MKSGQWVHSTNEEHYSSDGYDTKAEAIDAARDEYDPRDGFYVAQVRQLSAAEYMNFDSWAMIHRLAESAAEQVGEVSDTWPDVSRDQADALRDMLMAQVDCWADLYGMQPTFYATGKVEHIPGWTRDNQITVDLLGLVGIRTSVEAVSLWLDDEAFQVDQWAGAEAARGRDWCEECGHGEPKDGVPEKPACVYRLPSPPAAPPFDGPAFSKEALAKSIEKLPFVEGPKL